MKLNKYMPFALMLFLAGITSTRAACTQEEINTFKKVEDKYTVKYEFNKNTKDYALTFYMPLPDRYDFSIRTEMNHLKYVISTDNSYTYSGFKSGKYIIDISGITNTCTDILKTIELELPEYNELSEDPLCDGIEEFVLCSPTYNKEIDYDSFVSRVETYKRSKAKKEQEEEKNIEPEEEKNPLEPMIDYIKENMVTIIIFTVFTILLVITIVITAKSIRKSRRLE